MATQKKSRTVVTDETVREGITPPRYNKTFGGVKIDAYRVLERYGISRPAVQHAIKKLLRAGKSIKSYRQDIEESVAALQREIEMLDEEGYEEQGL